MICWYNVITVALSTLLMYAEPIAPVAGCISHDTLPARVGVTGHRIEETFRCRASQTILSRCAERAGGHYYKLSASANSQMRGQPLQRDTVRSLCQATGGKTADQLNYSLCPKDGSMGPFLFASGTRGQPVANENTLVWLNVGGETDRRVRAVPIT